MRIYVSRVNREYESSLYFMSPFRLFESVIGLQIVQWRRKSARAVFHNKNILLVLLREWEVVLFVLERTKRTNKKKFIRWSIS